MSLHEEFQTNISSVSSFNNEGSFPAIIICEHASNFIPTQFENLGLPAEILNCHVAWDPGADEVAHHLSNLLDAPYVKGEVSRLVYDCNRPPEASDAMPEKSEIYEILGNKNLSKDERTQRIEQVYLPFRNHIRDLIKGSKAIEALITIHSFTPTYNGKTREVEIGILHDEDTRLADVMLSLADKHTQLITMRNEPYGPQHGVTHTLREHGISNNLLNVMIEIRNDLLTSSEQCETVAKMLHELLLDSFAFLDKKTEKKRQA